LRHAANPSAIAPKIAAQLEGSGTYVTKEFIVYIIRSYRVWYQSTLCANLSPAKILRDYGGYNMFSHITLFTKTVKEISL